MVISKFSTLKLVYNSIKTFAKMYFIFSDNERGWRVFEDFRKAIQLKKIKKWSV